MATIEVDQAVFTSARSAHIRGYHLVSRSDGITDPIATTLCQWSPSHDGMCQDDIHANCINFYSIDSRRFALSRTVLGGPEYSQRGGLQTVTLILVFDRALLASYSNNVLNLHRIALSMGYLRLTAPFRTQLPRLTMPTTSLLNAPFPAAEMDLDVVNAVLDVVKQGRDAAVIGLVNPLPTLYQVINAFNADDRLRLSFTTGLKPTSQRRFRLQFLPCADLTTRTRLSSERVSLIKVPNQGQRGALSRLNSHEPAAVSSRKNAF